MIKENENDAAPSQTKFLLVWGGVSKGVAGNQGVVGVGAAEKVRNIVWSCANAIIKRMIIVVLLIILVT